MISVPVAELDFEKYPAKLLCKFLLVDVILLSLRFLKHNPFKLFFAFNILQFFLLFLLSYKNYFSNSPSFSSPASTLSHGLHAPHLLSLIFFKILAQFCLRD